MPRKPRRIFIIAAASLAVAVLGYTAYWFVLAGEAREVIARWSENWRAAGFAVSHGEPDLGGFPLSLRASFAAPSVGRGDGAQAWRWRGEGVTVSLRPWNLSRLGVRMEGRHEITVGEPGGRRYTLDAERAAATVTLDGDGGVERIDAALAAFAVREDAWSAPLRIGRLRLEGFGYRRAGGGARATDVTLVVEDAELPAAPAGALGKNIARVRADITLVGAFPERPLEAAMAAWRDDGGTVELRGLVVRWGPLDLSADGTLALDSEMRPIAALAASIAGVDEAVASLLAAGSIGAAEAAAMRVAFNLFARITSSSGDRVNVPITAQEGRIFVGPVAVARIGPLRAPDS